MKKVLIVVDMQKDFIDGSLGTKEAEAIVPVVAEEIEQNIKQNAKVIFTRDTHQENYLETNEGKYLPVKHCIENTMGWKIHEDLFKEQLLSDAEIINKPTFGFTDWKEYIPSDVDEIELIGLCTDICVVSNALILKAMYPEVKMTVRADACAGVTPEKHEAALETMRSCQIEVF